MLAFVQCSMVLPERGAFRLFHFPYLGGLMITECTVTIPGPWVISESPGLRSQARQGKEHSEAEGLGEIAESVHFYQESRSSQKPHLANCSLELIGRNWVMLGPLSCEDTGKQDCHVWLVQRYIVPPSEIGIL